MSSLFFTKPPTDDECVAAMAAIQAYRTAFQERRPVTRWVETARREAIATYRPDPKTWVSRRRI